MHIIGLKPVKRKSGGLGENRKEKWEIGTKNYHERVTKVRSIEKTRIHES